MASRDSVPWQQVLAATAGVLVGVGLARFAYSPLLPVLIAQGWFAPGAAGYLGAANLLGYLGGALAARAMAGRFGTRAVLRGAMLAVAVALAACSLRLPFAWFFGWRLLSGICGGLLMILAPSSVLSHVPAVRRGLAGGVVFTGVGLGIAASGTLVPLLLRWGLAQAWLGLAAVALALTAAAWRAWPVIPAVPTAGSGTPGRFLPLSAVYGLCAVGLVPHMVFLVDFVARGLGRGLAVGSLTWVVFGMGALCGPMAAGRAADRVGPAAAMRCIVALEAASVAALLVAPGSLAAILASAAVAGTLLPGVTAVALGRISLMAGTDGATRQRGWTQATVAWAIGQAAGAYGLAALYAATGRYAPMFEVALAALAAAGVIEAALTVQARPRLASAGIDSVRGRPKPARRQ